MVDFLVRNLDEDLARRMKEKAARMGTSVNEAARQALREFVMPTRQEAFSCPSVPR